MRSIAVAGTVLALTGLGTAPALAHPTTAAEPETEHQRGFVLECTGDADGLSAYVSVYENDKHGNVLQVVLNENPGLAGSVEPADLIDGGRVAGVLRIKGHKARVTGTAHRVGKRTPVHEEVDDAGQHIVSDGFHRRVKTEIALHYRGDHVPLTCAPAFFYRLEVTKTDITE